MVSFGRFNYNFPMSKRAAWTALLLKVFGDMTIKLSWQGLSKDTKMTNEDLEKTFQLFVSQGAKDQDIISVDTGSIWKMNNFWKMLSEPVFSLHDDPGNPQVDKALKSIYSIANGDSRLAYNKDIQIPFEHIEYILFKLNEKNPIKALYYSPSAPRVDILLKSDNEVAITNNNISNCQVGYILDFDDGLCTGQLANYTVTAELKEDFENWLSSDTFSTEMFRPQIFGKLTKIE